MELKQLQFLVACAETHSFSKAASLLYTSQSNISKVIKSLEDELGVELFERKQYGITLTEKGKKIYEYATTTLKNAQHIMEYSRQPVSEELHISCNPSSWMSAAFCDYYREHQTEEIIYHVITASTNEIIQRLSDDIDHLGFIYIMEGQLPNLQNRFEKSHLLFTTLKRTKALVYTGRNRTDVNMEYMSLIQGYEDEFTLKSYWNEEFNGEDNKVHHNVAVTTNSDYIMNELLNTTNLVNISAADLDDNENLEKQNAISLYGEEEPVLFGCLFRNDKKLSKQAIRYLSFIKNRVV